MIAIVPAILPKSYADLEKHLEFVRHATRAVQIDVVDGIFAPNKTYPYTEADSFQKIISEDEGLPFWEDFDFEFDCMVEHAEREVEKFVHAGASRIIMHVKSIGARGAVEALQSMRGGDLGIAVGIALSSNASVFDLDQFAGLYDFVQVMCIAQVGFQGQPFDERAISLLSSVRAAHPQVELQADGAVNIDNARALVAAGATRLVVGSAIFGADSPQSALNRLYTKVNVG